MLANPSQQTGFGPLLRQWRAARRMSQQQLAIESEVSTRHISFVENGKSAPSREMVLVLSNALDMPLRDRNAMLSAAGYAPIYRESQLADPNMEHIRRALRAILKHQEPYPAIVLSRTWDILEMNDGAQRAFMHLLEPPFDASVLQNAMHAVFHPTGLRRFIVNWEELAGFLIDRLYREAMTEPEASDYRILFEALRQYPEVPERLRTIDLTRSLEVCITLHVKKGNDEARFFTTMTTLGTPLDVTLEELRIESYFPADQATEAWAHRLANQQQAQ